jgi:phosphoribosylformylglycinamidine cyclo-ligase
MPPRTLRYTDSGVDVDRGDRFVDQLAPFARATHRPGVLAGVGGFAGLFALNGRFRDPVLVAGTDGVGTKLKLAFATQRHATIGRDLVAMCVNDVLCTGAEPLFFLDYFATGRIEPETALQVVRGIADGCADAGCALLGGETAEMPGFYGGGEYDLAGFAVGAVERERIVDGRQVRPGDVLLGLPSSGLHSNGFALARKALLEVARLPLDGPSIGGAHPDLAAELLEPTRIYAQPVLDLLAHEPVHAIAHVTGGGLEGNVPRVLPENTCAVLDRATWREPAVLAAIRSAGVDDAECARTFNLGLGMVLAVPVARKEACIARLAGHGIAAVEVGAIEASTLKEPSCRLVGAPSPP